MHRFIAALNRCNIYYTFSEIYNGFVLCRLPIRTHATQYKRISPLYEIACIRGSMGSDYYDPPSSNRNLGKSPLGILCHKIEPRSRSRWKEQNVVYCYFPQKEDTGKRKREREKETGFKCVIRAQMHRREIPARQCI